MGLYQMMAAGQHIFLGNLIGWSLHDCNVSQFPPLQSSASESVQETDFRSAGRIDRVTWHWLRGPHLHITFFYVQTLEKAENIGVVIKTMSVSGKKEK